MNNKAILMILDGWGIGQLASSDAIQQAKTPFFKSLMAIYPNTTLDTFGEFVGLPEGQMGNSEVGHLNLGAGRIVYQDFALINKNIAEGSFEQNKALQALFNYCQTTKKPLHLIGLVSDGGVHSHINHLKAIITAAEKAKLDQIFIHAITDGRDTDPKSGALFLADLNRFIQNKKITISSLIGRYYAMDRDKRWERIKKAYDLLIHGVGEKFSTVEEAISASYGKNITDEFIEPSKIGNPTSGLIQEGDAVFCFNFRTDRLRELTEVLSQHPVEDYNMKPLNVHMTTMANYDAAYENVQVIYDKLNIPFTLGEVLSTYGLTQLRIAETEKYPHVSFFFSGGRENVFSGERRILVPSPKVATYDLQPEMSAKAITDALCNDISDNAPDFICLNYANADMVGHTGVFSAVVKAVETVDQCLSQIIPHALTHGYDIIMVADHGNADFMVNADGSPNTAHTKNQVPCILITNKRNVKLKHGKLADIAPTLLQLLKLPIPKEMTGDILI